MLLHIRSVLLIFYIQYSKKTNKIGLPSLFTGLMPDSYLVKKALGRHVKLSKGALICQENSPLKILPPVYFQSVVLTTGGYFLDNTRLYMLLVIGLLAPKFMTNLMVTIRQAILFVTLTTLYY